MDAALEEAELAGQHRALRVLAALIVRYGTAGELVIGPYDYAKIPPNFRIVSETSADGLRQVFRLVPPPRAGTAEGARG